MAASVKFLVSLFAIIICHGNSIQAKSKQGCNTQACYLKEAENSIIKLMDTSRQPCDNFYEYACGKFINSVDLATLQESKSTLANLESDAWTENRKLLVGPATHNVKGSYEVKMKNLYTACMNTAKIDSVGLSKYTSRIKNDWPTINTKWNSSTYNLETLLKKFQRDAIPVFFEMDLGTYHTGQHQKYQLLIRQRPLELSSEEWLGATPKSAEIKRLKKYYIDIAKALGGNAATAKRDADDVIDFLLKFAKRFNTEDDYYDSSKTTNGLTLADLNKNFNFVDWVEIIKHVFQPMKVSIDSSQRVMVEGGLQFLTGLKLALCKRTSRTVQNVFGFSQALSLIGKSTTAMNKIKNDIFFGGNAGSRVEYCTHFVSRRFAVGMAKLVSRTRLPPSSKKIVDDMVNDMKASYEANLKKQTWLSASAKQKSILKIKRMTARVGIPSKNFGDANLDTYYKDYTVDVNNFMDSVHNTRVEKLRNRVRLLNKPYDPSRWEDNMLDANFYIQYEHNMMTYFLGLLQRPMFDANNPSYMNFGSLGPSIAHEMSHGFDTDGVNYDHSGREIPIWTAVDKAAFKKRAKCLENQFSSIHDTRANMSITSWPSCHNEMISDHLALGPAFQAFEKYAARHPNEKALPTLNMSNAKVFFLSLAQIYCEVLTDEELRGRMANARYPPYVYRLNVLLQNNQDFASTYNCPKGSFMNPTQKCNLFD